MEFPSCKCVQDRRRLFFIANLLHGRSLHANVQELPAFICKGCGRWCFMAAWSRQTAAGAQQRHALVIVIVSCSACDAGCHPWTSLVSGLTPMRVNARTGGGGCGRGWSNLVGAGICAPPRGGGRCGGGLPDRLPCPRAWLAIRACCASGALCMDSDDGKHRRW